MARTSPSSPSRRASTTADHVGLWLIGAGAALVALLHAVGIVLAGRQTLGSGPLEVRDMTIGDAATPAFTEPIAAITDARYESVTITVEGAPQSARWLLWGADAVSSLAAIGICLALLWLCVRVARQRPFGRSISAALLTTAALVMAGGVLGQFLGAIGRAEIVSFLGPESTGGYHGAGAAEGFLGLAMEISLAPIGIGLALGVVAAAFEIGARLQRDTEGLV
ncbi:hypothetical protein V2J52_14895 [Georgenia sp. MJ173]|uniref:hypothetical protein n=1 Tax=Georgenia sunbinii TaxID=3117728 RepID=UPI002F26CE57